MASSDPVREVERTTLLDYLDQYLEASQGTDYCPNGLQVEGPSRISKIVTGVSACLELFQTARDKGADTVLVHHGLFWKGDPQPLTGVQFRRVAELIRADLNLIAYHLPLDRHLEVGNNAVAARRLGLKDIQPFCELEDLPIGVCGRYASAESRSEVFEKIEALFGQKSLSFPFGSETIHTVGIVSGAAGRCFHQALASSLDLFITGEAEEWSMNLAKETRTNFVAAGHYATERLGVQALGQKLQHEFGLHVEFVDIPNPV